ncbi:hypothetical protein BSKO_02630 [Bryopsis sp. KO-2023]|nr:hypothetical protein BSKO_02630 [Bryopsis sp. KO-2023]
MKYPQQEIAAPGGEAHSHMMEMVMKWGSLNVFKLCRLEGCIPVDRASELGAMVAGRERFKKEREEVSEPLF